MKLFSDLIKSFKFSLGIRNKIEKSEFVPTGKDAIVILDSDFPKKVLDVGKHKIIFCKFEASKEALIDPKKFALIVLSCFGSSPEISGPKEIEINIPKLLVAVGLAPNTKTAIRLMKQKVFNIGEPAELTRKLTEETMVIKDPYNALLTINRSWSDWVLVTFGG